MNEQKVAEELAALRKRLVELERELIEFKLRLDNMQRYTGCPQEGLTYALPTRDVDYRFGG